MTGDNYRQFEHVSACDLCGGVRLATVDRAASVVECPECGFRFVTPRPVQAEIARAYSQAGPYATWLGEADARDEMWDRRWQRVKRLAGQPGRLLDVGAGLGTFAARARHDGWTVDGTEVSASAVRHAREELGIDLRLGQIEELELSPGYDLITLWHVLEHVPSPASTLARCRDLLAADGMLVMAVPNDGRAARALSGPGIMLRRLLGRAEYRYQPLVPGIEAHLSHFTPGTIRQRLVLSGFGVHEVSVDDAAPSRSMRRRATYEARRLLSALTPWNFGLELFIAARVAGRE